jgi:hypothetical protein
MATNLCWTHSCLLASVDVIEFQTMDAITSTDANRLECIQQRYAALCSNRYFPQVHYCYSLALVGLILCTLHMRRHHLNALYSSSPWF